MSARCVRLESLPMSAGRQLRSGTLAFRGLGSSSARVYYKFALLIFLGRGQAAPLARCLLYCQLVGREEEVKLRLLRLQPAT